MVRPLLLAFLLYLLTVEQSSCIILNYPTSTNAFYRHMLGSPSRNGCSMSGGRNRLKLLSHISSLVKAHHHSPRMSMHGLPPMHRSSYEDTEPFSRFTKRAPILNTGLRNCACDTTRLTLQTIIEYINTGRICGFQVAGVRFGLGK